MARNVSAAGVDLGGLTQFEAQEALRAHEDALLGASATFRIEEATVTLDPTTVGLELDEEAIAAEAMSVGRGDGWFASFLDWTATLWSDTELAAPVAFDRAAIEGTLIGWETQVLGVDLAAGGVELDGSEPRPVYPGPVVRIDRPSAIEAIESTLRTLNRPAEVELTTDVSDPPLDRATIDDAVAAARNLLAGPVTLTSADPPAMVAVSIAELAAAFTSDVELEPEPAVVIGLDPDLIESSFEGLREQFEGEFKNAEFEIVGDTVTIVEGVKGPRVLIEDAIDEILAAAQNPAREGQLPLQRDADPDITAADLEALHVNHLVSSFTTYHDCCASRVTNIHLFADAVDGTLLMPGEEFSLNGHVGERTSDKGYLPAGTIVDGELIDTVGGGVSQFATTFYNAVFWGGYDDIEHKPHSFYFSRYPEGIEATINWPNVDLAFRNDSDAALLIDTQYTDTSISVRFFGDNDGRIVTGEQSGGVTSVTVVAEGGPDARIVEGSVSGRYNFTSPSTRYRASSGLSPESSRTVQSGREGWSVTVTRTITHPGGGVETEEWIVRYLAQPTIIEVHPCKVPGSSTPCPTTTTAPPATSPPPTQPPATNPPAPPPTTTP